MAQRLSRFVPSRKTPPKQPQIQHQKTKRLSSSTARIVELGKSLQHHKKHYDVLPTAQTIADSHTIAPSNDGGPFGFLRSHVLKRTHTNVLAIKNSLIDFASKHQFETEVTSLACIGSIVHECSSIQVFMFGLATLILSNIVWRMLDQYQKNVVVEDSEIESKKKIKKQRKLQQKTDEQNRRQTPRSNSVSVRLFRQSATARESSRRTQSTLRESYVTTTGDVGGVVEEVLQHKQEKVDDDPEQLITYKQARRWVDAHLGQFNALMEHFLGLFVAFDVFQAIRSYATMKILNSYFFKQEFSSLFVVGNLSLLVLPRLYGYYKPMLTWMAAVFGREFKRALLLVWKLLLGYNNMLYDAQQLQVRHQGRLGRAVQFRRDAKNRKVVVA